MWNHLLEHGRVAFQKLKPRLAGTLPDTTGQDYDCGPVQVLVIARTDPDGRGKRSRVEYIFGLRLCQLRVQIDEYNFVGHAAERDGISGTTADETTANNTDFHFVLWHDVQPRQTARILSRPILRLAQVVSSAAGKVPCGDTAA